ncbi:MAG: ABC transporter permease, partial [candidate division WOR-3 bacterium]
IAVGQTLVIISGGIDLSVGSVMALCAVVAALLMRQGVHPLLGGLTGVGIGGFCGLVNGLLSTKGRLPPFIATLGMMGIARGAALIISHSRNIFGLPDSFLRLGTERWFGVPVSVILMAIIAAGAHFMLTFTSLGRHIYAIGGNREAARLSAIPVDRSVTLVFVLCGLATGFAGMIEAAWISIGQPTGGQMYELQSIAATVIGGASLMGGEGTVFGTVIGAFIMLVIRNGCDLRNVPFEYQQVAIGAIVIVAVFYDQWRRRGRR